MTQNRPALFLDRDGVMVEEVEFLHRIEDGSFMPGLFELTAAASARGYVVIMATNQSGIGRGIYDEATFTRLRIGCARKSAKAGGVLDAVYYAPTHPTAAKGDFRRESDWRKPGPGMFLAGGAGSRARSCALGLYRQRAARHRRQPPRRHPQAVPARADPCRG